MKKLFLLIFLVSFVGCSHMGTVKYQLKDQTFQAENLPYRVLSVFVISDGSWPEASIRTTISNVSNLTMGQVGIRLRIDAWMNHPLPSFTPTEGLQNMVQVIGKDHENYDFLIGFSSRSVASHLIEVAFWFAWLGAIDDLYRKFIIIKFLDEGVLLHEICHAFVFTRDHGISGVLTAVPIKIPLVPIIFNLPEYVSKEDRREMLLNKWRDFNEKPPIPEPYQMDKIEVPAY